MESTVKRIFANGVWLAQADMKSRLEYQAEALKEIKCINLIVGQWIAQNGVDYLLSVLDLDDHTLGKRFPSFTLVNYERRQRMKAAIESHLENCPHCSLKRGYELEMDALVEKLARQDKDYLLECLEEDEPDQSEGEHLDSQSFPDYVEQRGDIHNDPGTRFNPVVEIPG